MKRYFEPQTPNAALEMPFYKEVQQRPDEYGWR
jgi:hypothetical protein